MLPIDTIKSLKMFPLSDTAVSRSIDELESNIEKQLISIFYPCLFSKQLDESTIVDN